MAIMVRYRLNMNGHLVSVSEAMGDECSEWEEKQVGDKYVFTCVTNPSLERVYTRDEVVILE